MSGTRAFLLHPCTDQPLVSGVDEVVWRSQRRFCPRWMCHSGNLALIFLPVNPHGWCQRDECDSAARVSRLLFAACSAHAFSPLQGGHPGPTGPLAQQVRSLLHQGHTRARHPDLLTRHTRAEFVFRNLTEILRGRGCMRWFRPGAASETFE